MKTSCGDRTKKYVGKLYLIDLAGSEDNRRTGNTGIRFVMLGADFVIIVSCKFVHP